MACRSSPGIARCEGPGRSRSPDVAAGRIRRTAGCTRCRSAGPEELAPRVAGHLAHPVVHVRDRASGVDRDEAVHRGLDEAAQVHLLVAELLLELLLRVMSRAAAKTPWSFPSRSKNVAA